MKLIQSLTVIAIVASNLSWAPIHHVGLLTDDYGIVTAQDLVEEEDRCQDLEPFPPRGGGCLQYWQCLPTKDVFIGCEDISADLGGEDTRQAVFWLKDGDEVHHYLTRRNFDLEACNGWKAKWEAVLAGEDVVCLSGEFINTENFDEHLLSPPGTQFYWIIDRMKSRHGEWSYFYRGPEVSRTASE